MIDPGKDKAPREERKVDRMKVWKRFKSGDTDPDTGKKLTKTTAEKKNKANRTDRIRTVVPDYKT